jgi:ribosome maturation factor RimP
LVRPADYERFAGQQVAVLGHTVLWHNSRRVEGQLLGLAGVGTEQRVRLRLADGSVLEVPREDIARAHLVFRWPGPETSGQRNRRRH